jgi:malate dehydrogenase (oxaloacetate-decarboxylating)
VTGIPLSEQRVAFFGFGGAGIGIAQLMWSLMRDAGLSDRDAYARFYAMGRHGLLIEGGQGVRPEQASFARPSADVAGWKVQDHKEIGLLDVVRNAKPTVLIGVSSQAGAFTEEAVRTMAKYCERPIIFPLSNPTSRCEATPQQVLDWTDGRALIGTGSPFGPAKVNGKEVRIDQTNNSYIFPGLALGVISSKAKHVSDAMIKTSAKALAELAPTRRNKNANLLPPLSSIRSVSLAVARAVGRQTIQEGLATMDEVQLEQELAANVWEPVYEPYERVS